MLSLILLIFIIYIVFIFYEEIFYKGVLVLKFNTDFIIKKYINFKFSLEINILTVVDQFFKVLILFNKLNPNIKINFFKRPGTLLQLFLFNLIYNFSFFFFIISFRSVFEWIELLEWLVLLEIEPEPEFWILVAKKGSFLMYMLLILEFLIIIVIACFIWWKFEYVVLIPLNIFLILCCFFSFFFNFFWKSFIYLLLHSINFIIICFSKISVYYFKITIINFYNNFWFRTKYFMWYRSNLLTKVWICIYIFITFNIIVLFLFIYIYNIIFFGR